MNVELIIFQFHNSKFLVRYSLFFSPFGIFSNQRPGKNEESLQPNNSNLLNDSISVPMLKLRMHQ